MKSIAILVPLLLSTSVVQAQTLSDAIASCGKQTDSLKRLVCYDTIAKKIDQAIPVAQNRQTAKPTIVSPSPAIAPVLAPKPTERQVEKKSEAVSQFGMERRIAEEKAADKIYAQVSSITKDPYGKLTVLLDNEQTWKQIDSNKLRIKVGDRLYIERGVLGSFFMSKDDVNRRVRVKRTK